MTCAVYYRSFVDGLFSCCSCVCALRIAIVVLFVVCVICFVVVGCWYSLDFCLLLLVVDGYFVLS